jgi:signal transduction histidine kinase
MRTKGKQAISSLTTYAILSLIFTYLTWPYLWMNPIGHFIESFKEMSLYPWEGAILFNGTNYQITSLPTAYLPVLLAIQLTEPVWALSLIGWLVSVLRRGEARFAHLMESSLLWFVLPLTAFIVMQIALYDNFRQILFILPPIFLMAGVAFEAVKQVKWQAVLIGLCLIPNLIGIVSLHPYEYIYYNRFIGGVDGAENRFEMDYWVTSYREAAEYVNSVASPNASIWVEGPANLFTPFAREDLKIYSPNEAERAESYEYIVAATRYNFDKTSYPDAEIVYKIMRGDAVLTVIKKP